MRHSINSAAEVTDVWARLDRSHASGSVTDTEYAAASAKIRKAAAKHGVQLDDPPDDVELADDDDSAPGTLPVATAMRLIEGARTEGNEEMAIDPDTLARALAAHTGEPPATNVVQLADRLQRDNPRLDRDTAMGQAVRMFQRAGAQTKVTEHAAVMRAVGPRKSPPSIVSLVDAIQKEHPEIDRDAAFGMAERAMKRAAD